MNNSECSFKVKLLSELTDSDAQVQLGRMKYDK